jgi:hypothetical protein
MHHVYFANSYIDYGVELSSVLGAFRFYCHWVFSKIFPFMVGLTFWIWMEMRQALEWFLNPNSEQVWMNRWSYGNVWMPGSPLCCSHWKSLHSYPSGIQHWPNWLRPAQFFLQCYEFWPKNKLGHLLTVRSAGIKRHAITGAQIKDWVLVLQISNGCFWRPHSSLGPWGESTACNFWLKSVYLLGSDISQSITCWFCHIMNLVLLSLTSRLF